MHYTRITEFLRLVLLMGKRGPQPGRKASKSPTNLRLDTVLRQKLIRAALREGRSLTDEITERLQSSFALLKTREAEFGDLTTYHFCRLIAYALADIKQETGHPWHRNRFAFEHARRAVEKLFSLLAVPPGDAGPPDDAPVLMRLKAAGVTDLRSVVAQFKTAEIGHIAALSAVSLLEASEKNATGVDAELLAGLTRLFSRVDRGKALHEMKAGAATNSKLTVRSRSK